MTGGVQRTCAVGGQRNIRVRDAGDAGVDRLRDGAHRGEEPDLADRLVVTRLRVQSDLAALAVDTHAVVDRSRGGRASASIDTSRQHFLPQLRWEASERGMDMDSSGRLGRDAQPGGRF